MHDLTALPRAIDSVEEMTALICELRLRLVSPRIQVHTLLSLFRRWQP